MNNPKKTISGMQSDIKKGSDLLNEGMYALLNKVKEFTGSHILNKKSKEQFASTFLSGLAKEIEIVQGLFMLYHPRAKQLTFLASYAGPKREAEEYTFNLGEGFPGQVAADRKTIVLNELPKEYLKIKTGLGEARPKSLIVMPVQVRTKLIGVLELASFKAFSTEEIDIINNLTDYLAEELMKIKKIKKEEQ